MKSVLYDVEAWGREVFTYESLVDFKNKFDAKDGIHQIRMLNGGRCLDILLQDMDLIKRNIKTEKNSMLVCFDNAVTKRAGKVAPFFAGTKMAKKLKTPLIAVADPTMALSEVVQLGWYLGDEENLDLPIKIAVVLDFIAEFHNVRLVIFGGSGGGFASLLQSSLINSEAKVLVWNPQTSAVEYVRRVVDEYKATAFPGGDVNIEDTLYNIRSILIKKNVEVLYIQNISDWHLYSHGLPFFEGRGLKKIDKRSFRAESIHFFIGDWGSGHAIPQRALLERILSGFVSGDSIDEVCKRVEKGISKPKNIVYFSGLDDIGLMEIKSGINESNLENCIFVKAKKEGGSIKLKARYASCEGVFYSFKYKEMGTEKSSTFEASGKLELKCEKDNNGVVIVSVRDVFGNMVKKEFDLDELVRTDKKLWIRKVVGRIKTRMSGMCRCANRG